jgi:hypothetical protein
MAQMGPFQVKAMFFQVAKHFFNPQAQGEFGMQQIGRQEPGFLLANLPMQDEMGQVRAGAGQHDVAQPSPRLN